MRLTLNYAARTCDLAADGEDGDVVLLAEGFGGISQVEGRLLAQVADAIEAEKLAGGLARLDHSVGEQENAVAGMEIEAGLFIADLGQHAQRKSAGQGDLLAVEIGRQMAGVGDDHLAIGRQTRRPGRW